MRIGVAGTHESVQSRFQDCGTRVGTRVRVLYSYLQYLGTVLNAVEPYYYIVLGHSRAPVRDALSAAAKRHVDGVASGATPGPYHIRHTRVCLMWTEIGPLVVSVMGRRTVIVSVMGRTVKVS